MKKFPDWARPKENPPNQNEKSLNDTTNSNLKKFPKWAENSSNEINMTVKEAFDILCPNEQENNLPDWAKNPSTTLPDWASSPPRYEKKKFTAEQILHYKRNWLLKRHFGELIAEADDELIHVLYDQIRFIEKKYNILISPDKLDESFPLLIRETQEDELIHTTALWLEIQFEKTLPLQLPPDFQIPKPQDFTFPRYAESTKYIFTHCVYDIETDYITGQPITIGCFNLEAKRTVIGIWEKDRTTTEIIAFEHNIYCVFTNNLWEAMLLCDIETVLAATCTSALQEGHNDLISILDTPTLAYAFKNIHINAKLFEEILNGIPQRRSIWKAHHAQFDIDMTNHTHNHAKHQFNLFKHFNHEKLNLWLGQITDKSSNAKIDAYTIELGNSKAGFKFSAKFNTKTKLPKLILAPLQKDSYSFIFGLDTMRLSIACQNPKHSLKELSKNSIFHKKDSNYKFKQADFILTESNTTISKELHYLMYDLYATICVYQDLAEQLDYPELARLLEITYEASIPPKTSKIISSATISKQTLFPLFEKKTGLTREQIEINIEHQRLYTKNFEKVFLGGRSETLAHGAIYNEIPQAFYTDDMINTFITQVRTDPSLLTQYDFSTNRVLKYDDFESLYPSIARIILTEDIYLLACQNKLHNYFSYDIKQAKQYLLDSLKTIITSIKNLTPLPDTIFINLLGTVEFTTKIKLLIRDKTKNKAIDEYKIGSIHCHLLSLLMAIIREHFESNRPIESILNNLIHITKVERLALGNAVPPPGNEFATLLLALRRIKKKSNDPIEKFLKFIMNTATYGISVEGIHYEDHSGKLFIAAVGSNTTEGSKALTTIAELAINYWQGISLYTDTDSIISLIHPFIRALILRLFDAISTLKEETDYGIIEACYIAKRKGYALLSSNIATHKLPHLKIEDNLYITGKIHGRSNYVKKEYTNTIFSIYKDILYSKMPLDEAINTNLDQFPLFRTIQYRTKEDSTIKGILKFFQKSQSIAIKNKDTKKKRLITFKTPSVHLRTIDFHFKNELLPIQIYYNTLENTFLFTNLQNKPIKSQFGIFANLGLVRIFYTIPYLQENYYDLEHALIDLILRFFSNDNLKDLFFSLGKEQAKVITKYLSTSKELYTTEIKRYFLKDEETSLSDKQTYNRIRRLIDNNELLKFSEQIYEEQYTNISNILTHKNIFLDFKPYNEPLRTLTPKEERLFNFAEDIITYCMYDDDWDSIETKDLPRSYKKYLYFLGADIQTISPNDSPAQERNKLIHNSNQMEALASRIQELLAQNFLPPSPYAIIDHYFNTELHYYYLEKNKIDNHVLTDQELDYQDSTAYFNFQAYLSKMKNKLLDQTERKRTRTKLKKYFEFNDKKLLRTIEYYFQDRATILKPYAKPKEEHDTMLTIRTLQDMKATDGFDYTMFVRLLNLDFSTDLRANLNTYYTKNIINCAKIASYIYYLTHNQAEKIPKLWHSAYDNLPATKSTATVQIALKFRKLLPHKAINSNYNTKHIHENNHYSEKDMTLFFSAKELEYLRHRQIVKHTKNIYIIKNAELFANYYYKILKQSWILYSEYFTNEDINSPNIFPKIIPKTWLNNEWALEIKPIKSLDYNAKLFLFFLVGKHRVLRADMHINPLSRNLMNLNLFKTSISELEQNSFIITELIKDLFSHKKLSLYSRNASLTITDLKLKKNMSYLREILYLTLAHKVIEERLDHSSTKLGQIALSGDIKLKKELKAQNVMPIIIQAIQKKFNDHLDTLDIKEQLRLRTEDISVMPHRSSSGITTNHWKTKIGRIAASIYVKDQNWLYNKVARVTRSRKIEITDENLNFYKNFENNTIRYEISLWGFNAIHFAEYHELLDELHNFINETITNYYNTNQEQKTEEYTNLINTTSLHIPSVMYQPNLIEYIEKRQLKIFHSPKGFG